MTKIVFRLTILLFCSINGTAFAYDTETHALITNQAYSQSVLSQQGNGTIPNLLGLDSGFGGVSTQYAEVLTPKKGTPRHRKDQKIFFIIYIK